MAIVSHRRRFIFIKPRKVAGSSVQVALARLCGEEDAISQGFRFRPGLDTDEFADTASRNADWGGRYGRIAPHSLPEEVRARVGARVWNDYLKITVCRNPWDLFVSLYWFHARHAGREFRESFHRYPIRVARDLLHGRTLRSPRLEKMAAVLPILLRRRRLARYLDEGKGKEGLEFALRRGLFTKLLAEAPRFYLLDDRPYADCVLRYEHLQADFDEALARLEIPERPVLPRTRSEVRPPDDYRRYYSAWSRERVAAVCRPMLDLFGYRFDPDPA